MPVYSGGDPWGPAKQALLAILSSKGIPNSVPTTGVSTTGTTAATPPGGTTVPAAGTSGTSGGGTAGVYYNPGGYGPDDAANAAVGFTPGMPNTGQKDAFGNTYVPVQAGAWSGSYVDPKTLPGSSTVNAQLWGGTTSDSAPAWLKQIVDSAAAMAPGAERTARIKHIMDSLMTPGSGANQHDLGYAERAFGISA